MIPDGDYPLELTYTEKFGRIKRVKVGREKVGNHIYGRVRLDKEYCGEDIVILIPKTILRKVKKK